MSLEDPITGYKWPVAAERVIDAPAQEVWRAILCPWNLKLCHPFCARNPVHACTGSNSLVARRK